jgi:hypothetical protein
MDPLLQRVTDLKKQIVDGNYQMNCIKDDLCLRQLKYELKLAIANYRKGKFKK